MKNKILELKEEKEKGKEKKDITKYNLNEIDSKESLFKTILEKDKEISNLKLKLSRYPFELNEGEKLMTLIFTSIDQKINYSIICKNTDRFNLIENKLYDIYPEYSETENFFIVHGKKINKSKTIEDNQIGNNDIIILNPIE